MSTTTTLIRKTPLTIRDRTWTNISMDTFYGGDWDLFTKAGYILGQPGPHLFGAYVRLSSASEGQGIIRFARNIVGSKPNITGSQDWNFTPGKDFKSHVWFFNPEVGVSTGYQIYQSTGKDLTLEYAQLKAVPL